VERQGQDSDPADQRPVWRRHPYRNAQVAERRVGDAVLLTLNGYGHPSYQVPSTCIDQARTRYLVDLVTPPEGTVCQPDQRPF